MSDNATIERADLKVEVEESTVIQEMLEDDGTATTTQEENYEFKNNSAMTDDSITADNLEEIKMELLQLKLQEMELSKLQDSATGDKDDQEMLQKLKLELAMEKAKKENTRRQRIREECEGVRREIAKTKEDAVDGRTLTQDNDHKYTSECSKTVASEADERMQEVLIKSRKELQDTKQKEQEEIIQKLRRELSELKEAKEETAKREKARKEREHLKSEIERLKKEKNETTTREIEEFQKLKKEVEELKEAATGVRTRHKCEELKKEVEGLKEAATGVRTRHKCEELKKEVEELKEAATGVRTRDKCEELEKVKAKLEESATKVRTKTKVAELETEIRAEEARRREINRILQLMAAAQAVDLCFLVDCTGSMASYIQGVKEQIQNIVEKSKKMLPDLNFSVAFVGYRDHCDGATRIVVLDFTTSILEFQSFIGSVAATGGGDAPEDVFGGIEEVAKLSWSKQTRILFHIADSPCHGTRFHDPSVGDEYPNGDPRGLQIEDLLSKLEKLSIIYWFAKLGNATDLMVQVFQSIMKINQIDLASADDLVGAVAGSISASVNIHEENIGDEVVREGVRGEVEYKLDPRLPDWSLQEVKNVAVWKNKIPRDLDNFRKPLEVYSESKCSIKIAADPFAEGKLRIAYYGKYASDESGSSLVLKQFKYTSENQFIRYTEQMEIQSVAIALANKFNSIKPAGTRNVQFADVSTVTLTEGEGKSHFAMERYIPGKYVKFNNNAGFVNETAYTATLNAFSHWTYWATRRYLMVVDLQGVKEESSGEVRYVLTDPAIHCRSLRRFGKTNLGSEGMYKFFRTHYCNGICKAMALKFHRYQPTEVYTDFAGATVIA